MDKKHAKHFSEEEAREFKIAGESWLYKQLSTGDEIDWYNEYVDYVEVEQNGNKVTKAVTNLAKLSKCKARNIVKVPYSDDEIAEVLKLNEKKAWLELSPEERWSFIRRLHPSIHTEIISNMNRIDSPLDLKN